MDLKTGIKEITKNADFSSALKKVKSECSFAGSMRNNLNFDAVNQNGQRIHLDSVLKDGPLVLVFYRGQWCPFCNRHLAVFQDSLALVSAFGANVVALSPEQPTYLQAMECKSYELTSL